MNYQKKVLLRVGTFYLFLFSDAQYRITSIFDSLFRVLQRKQNQRDRNRNTKRGSLLWNLTWPCEILAALEKSLAGADLCVALRHLLSFPSPCGDGQDHRLSRDSVHDLKINGLLSALKSAIVHDDQAVKECGILNIKIATMDFGQCPNECLLYKL